MRNLLALAFALTLISMAPAPQEVSVDKVTGGGWIAGEGRAKIGFAFVARDPANPAGKLLFRDRAAGLRMRGSVTGYTIVDEVTRTFIGTAGSETFTVTVVDAGRGRGTDVFTIDLSGGYRAGGVLGGGNIKVHPPSEEEETD